MKIRKQIFKEKIEKEVGNKRRKVFCSYYSAIVTHNIFLILFSKGKTRVSKETNREKKNHRLGA